MQIPQYRFDNDIKLYNIGDVHRGDLNCDIPALYNIINRIAQEESSFWVSTGDLLNVATRLSKSSVYDSMPLKKELPAMVEELSPIAHKCLGIVSSNHHNRVENEIGLNLDEVISTYLGVPYLGDISVINLTCGRLSYFVAMHHGVGGGRSRGAKSAALARLSDVIPCADVYLEGHTHHYEYFPEEYPYIDRKRNIVSTVMSHFVCTGHFLKWEQSYVQKMKLRPAPIGCAMIEFAANNNGQHTNKIIKPHFVQ